MATTRTRTPGALQNAQDRFVDVWSRMGDSWGIPRTMARVHALLFVTGEALCSDEIMDRLAISRGNASTSLRGLLEWGLVRREHRRGDRKEYFLAEQDVWKLFRAIAEQRKRREIDPLVRELEEIRRSTEVSVSDGNARGTRGRLDAETAAIARHQQRIDDLVDFFRLIEAISKRVLEPDASRLRAAAQMLETAS